MSTKNEPTYLTFGLRMVYIVAIAVSTGVTVLSFQKRADAEERLARAIEQNQINTFGLGGRPAKPSARAVWSNTLNAWVIVPD